MLQVAYPIFGEYRLLLLTFDWLFMIASGEMGIIFIINYFKLRDKRNVQNLGFSSLCFSLSLGWFFQIASNYYIDGTLTLTIWTWNTIYVRTIVWAIGFSSVIIGGLIFIVLLDRNVIYLRQYLLTKIYAVSTSIFIVLFIWDAEMARMFVIVISFLILGFLFIFVSHLIKNVKTITKHKVTTIQFLGSAVVFGIGIFMTGDFGVIPFSFEIHLSGICLLLGSFIVLCTTLARLPSIAFLGWKKILEEVFLINKPGICLFQKSFSSHPRELDESLITSAITMVTIIIQEMVASGEQGFFKVEKEGKIIVIYSSALVNGAVISNEDHPAIVAKLKTLVLQFEEIYGGIIQNWNGSRRIFGPVESIIEEIFSP